MYVEYRAVSVSTQRVCPPPAPKAGGPHSPGGEGVVGQYFGRRKALDWPLTVQSLYGASNSKVDSEKSSSATSETMDAKSRLPQ